MVHATKHGPAAAVDAACEYWHYVHYPALGVAHARSLEILRDVIKVYFRDHPPPHFHAVYAEHQALYDIETLEVIEGDLPRTAAKLVVEWATLNQNALRRIWETQDFQAIPPLE
jgi:hypothetical protein